MRVKSSGMALGLANVGPQAAQNLQMPHPWPRDCVTDKVGMCPAVAGGGGGGGWVQVELTNA